MSLSAALVGATAAGILAWRWHTDRNHWVQWRDGLLESCATLLVAPIRSRDAAGWPRLSGVYQGRAASVSLLLDDAGYRKLPVLWVQVAIEVSQPHAGQLCAVARPNSNEYWCEFFNLQSRVAAPAQWPPEVAVRSDEDVPVSLPITEIGADFFNRGQGKALSISGTRILLTAMAMQSRRAEYLVLRASRFETAAVDRTQVEALLRNALQIANANSNAATTHAGQPVSRFPDGH